MGMLGFDWICELLEEGEDGSGGRGRWFFGLWAMTEVEGEVKTGGWGIESGLQDLDHLAYLDFSRQVRIPLYCQFFNISIYTFLYYGDFLRREVSDLISSGIHVYLNYFLNSRQWYGCWWKEIKEIIVGKRMVQGLLLRDGSTAIGTVRGCSCVVWAGWGIVRRSGVLWVVVAE